MMRKLLALMLVAVTAFAAVGRVEAQTEEPGDGQVAIAFLNLAPDAGAVDLLIGGEVIAQAVDYRQASRYVVIETGSDEVSIAVVPTGEDEDSAVLEVAEDVLSDQQRLIFVLTDTGDELLLLDILDTPREGDDQAHVQFSHLITGGDPVGVVVNGEPFSDNELEPGATVSGSLDVGTVEIEITSGDETLLTIEQELVGEASYAFFIYQGEDGPAAALVATQNGTLESLNAPAGDGTAEPTDDADATEDPDATETPDRTPRAGGGSDSPVVESDEALEFANVWMELIVANDWEEAYEQITEDQQESFGGSPEGMEELFASKRWDKTTAFELTEADEKENGTLVIGTADINGVTYNIEVSVVNDDDGTAILGFAVKDEA